MLKIIWLENVENQLDDIYDYYAKKVSISVAKKILSELTKAPNK